MIKRVTKKDIMVVDDYMNEKKYLVPQNQSWFSYKKIKGCNHIASFSMRDCNSTHRDSIDFRLRNYPIGEVSESTVYCPCGNIALAEQVGYMGKSCLNNEILFSYGVVVPTIFEE